MSAADHTDRFCLMRGAFLAAAGRKLNGYALVGMDERGELYWGSNILECSNAEAVQLADKLALMASHIRRSVASRKEPVPDARSLPTDVEATADLLGLVGIRVTPEIVSDWSEEQVDAAEEWAAAAHLEASDNDVKAGPMPAFLQSYVVRAVTLEGA